MKFTDVKEGDVLVADGGFTCIKGDAKLTVIADPKCGLYVPCDRGRHYLDAQHCDRTGVLIGFRRN